MTDIKFGVGCSTNWDPKVAGVEATVKALEQVNYKPKFLLVFCTIHYAKEKDGLQKLLTGCRSLVENDIPSIGGTVTGFICPEGCHTRGVVVVAGSGSNINVITKSRQNIRKNPKLCGESLGKDIAGKFIGNQGVIMEFMSGPIEPTVMTTEIGRKVSNRIPYRLLSVIRTILAEVATKYLNTGPAREEDILWGMSKYLKDYYFIGCATFDNMKCYEAYQFIDSTVLNGSISVIGLSFGDKVKLRLNRKIPLVATGKTVEVKTGWGEICIDKINGNPAVSEYIREMGWPEEYVQTHIEDISKKTWHYPLAFREDDWIYAFPAGLFFGEIIAMNRRVRRNTLELFLTSAKRTIDDFNELLISPENEEIKFMLVIAGMDILEILGSKINIMKDLLDEKLNNQGYLVLLGAGEYSKKPDEKAIMSNYSIVSLSITEGQLNRERGS